MVYAPDAEELEGDAGATACRDKVGGVVAEFERLCGAAKAAINFLPARPGFHDLDLMGLGARDFMF